MSINTGTIWITGISASGKTTLGERLVKNLRLKGIKNITFLDGEVLRKQLNKTQGYSVEERCAILKNTIQLTKNYNQSGKIVVVATISHKRKIREKARKEIGHFMEVYLKCPVESCAKRDYKGNYVKAFKGLYDNFVGVTEPYQVSENVELILDTDKDDVEKCSKVLLEEAVNFLQNGAGKK